MDANSITFNHISYNILICKLLNIMGNDCHPTFKQYTPPTKDGFDKEGESSKSSDLRNY